MPDLQDSSEDRSTAVLLEKQTRATFTRSREARQVAGASRQLLQNPRVAGQNRHCARAGFWLGLGQFIDGKLAAEPRSEDTVHSLDRWVVRADLSRYGDPVA
jgi:hypothetical protein